MPRKPPGVKFESFIDAQIRQAEEEGAFDDLPGKGRPMRDLEEASDPLWWAKKLIARESISDVPDAIGIRRKVEQVKEAIQRETSEARVRRRLEEVDAEIRKLNATVVSGPPTQVGPLDIDAIVADWRSRRAPTDGDEA